MSSSNKQKQNSDLIDINTNERLNQKYPLQEEGDSWNNSEISEEIPDQNKVLEKIEKKNTDPKNIPKKTENSKKEISTKKEEEKNQEPFVKKQEIIRTKCLVNKYTSLKDLCDKEPKTITRTSKPKENNDYFNINYFNHKWEFDFFIRIHKNCNEIDYKNYFHHWEFDLVHTTAHNQEKKKNKIPQAKKEERSIYLPVNKTSNSTKNISHAEKDGKKVASSIKQDTKNVLKNEEISTRKTSAASEAIKENIPKKVVEKTIYDQKVEIKKVNLTLKQIADRKF